MRSHHVHYQALSTIFFGASPSRKHYGAMQPAEEDRALNESEETVGAESESSRRQDRQKRKRQKFSETTGRGTKEKARGQQDDRLSLIHI